MLVILEAGKFLFVFRNSTYLLGCGENWEAENSPHLKKWEKASSARENGRVDEIADTFH